MVLADAKITWLETGKVTHTGPDGRFSFDCPVGSRVTFLFEKFGYHTTQSATLVVPPGGISGRFIALLSQSWKESMTKSFSKSLMLSSGKYFCWPSLTAVPTPSIQPSATLLLPCALPIRHTPMVYKEKSTPLFLSPPLSSKSLTILEFSMELPILSLVD